MFTTERRKSSNEKPSSKQVVFKVVTREEREKAREHKQRDLDLTLKIEPITEAKRKLLEHKKKKVTEAMDLKRHRVANEEEIERQKAEEVMKAISQSHARSVANRKEI